MILSGCLNVSKNHRKRYINPTQPSPHFLNIFCLFPTICPFFQYILLLNLHCILLQPNHPSMHQSFLSQSLIPSFFDNHPLLPFLTLFRFHPNHPNLLRGFLINSVHLASLALSPSFTTYISSCLLIDTSVIQEVI